MKGENAVAACASDGGCLMSQLLLMAEFHLQQTAAGHAPKNTHPGLRTEADLTPTRL